jgi:hypothetical protein
MAAQGAVGIRVNFVTPTLEADFKGGGVHLVVVLFRELRPRRGAGAQVSEVEWRDAR